RRSCAGLRLSMNFASMSPSDLTPLFCGSGLQKYDLFPNWQALFSIIFHLFFISLIYKYIKMLFFPQFPNFMGQFRQKKGVPGYQYGRFWQGQEDGLRCFRPVSRDSLMGAPYYI
ncbi:MAG: hypothetical protein IKH44_03145, partial [Bacteroidales bacterium]|nr:hypothetical protein [Bacteroidales bacterium]